MKLFRVSSITFMLFMILVSEKGALAHKGNGPPPSQVGSGICTDGQSLFVMAGDTLYQYSVEDISLVTTIALPRLTLPPVSNKQTPSSEFITRWTEKVKKFQEEIGGDNQTQSQTQPGGSGICTDGGHLFMLRGDTIYKFTISDMTLVKSVELPNPEPPTTD